MAADAMTKQEEEAWAQMAGADNARAATEGEPEPETEGGEAEPVPEGEASTEESKGRPRFVPHAALHEERTKRQSLEQENRKLLEERALFDGRLQGVLEMQRRQAEPQRQEQGEEEPDPTDYVGRIERAERTIAELRAGGQQRDQQQTEAQRQQAQVQHLAQAADADARQFRAKTADYGDAYTFFRQNRDAELELHGYSPADRAAIINQEELQIAHGAFQRGVSPAETLYKLAKHRGYAPKAANGAGSEATERVERVATGQQRAVTLSGTGGGATSPAMTVERLLKMDNAEFDRWTSDPKNARAAKRLMGG